MWNYSFNKFAWLHPIPELFPITLRPPLWHCYSVISISTQESENWPTETLPVPTKNTTSNSKRKSAYFCRRRFRGICFFKEHLSFGKWTTDTGGHAPQKANTWQYKYSPTNVGENAVTSHCIASCVQRCVGGTVNSSHRSDVSIAGKVHPRRLVVAGNRQLWCRSLESNRWILFQSARSPSAHCLANPLILWE